VDEIFFFGAYEHALDGQGRVAIPSEWRRREGETRLILFQGSNSDLLLFPFESFRDFLIKAQKISFADPAAQRALQRFGARARDCRCDKQGRIRLEKAHLDAVGITGQVMMVGGVTHIKLCSPKNWNPDLDAGDGDAEIQKINESDNELIKQLMNHLNG